MKASEYEIAWHIRDKPAVAHGGLLEKSKPQGPQKIIELDCHSIPTTSQLCDLVQIT